MEKMYGLPETLAKYIVTESIEIRPLLVLYCCIKDYLKCRGLKQHITYDLIVAVG